jgi:hypothetical protein
MMRYVFGTLVACGLMACAAMTAAAQDMAGYPDDIEHFDLTPPVVETHDKLMPTPDELTANIMLLLHGDCYHQQGLAEYECPFTTRGEDVMLHVRVYTTLRRLDGHGAQVTFKPGQHNKVTCRAAVPHITPLERGFDKRCTANGVPEMMEFRMVIEPQDGFAASGDNENVAWLEPGDFFGVWDRCGGGR